MYEKLKVGDKLAPITRIINYELVRKYLKALGEDVPDDIGEGVDFIVPPTIVSIFQKEGLGELVPFGIIHAKQEYSFLLPINLNDRLTTTIQIAEKYMSKGRKWLVVQFVTKNSLEEVVAIGSSWAIIP